MPSKRRREQLKGQMEGITNRLGVSAYMREVNYEVFQAVKSYLLKLYNKDKVIPPASEIPLKLEDLFSFFPPGILTLPTIVGIDPLENFTSFENALLAIVRYKDKRYFFSATIVRFFNSETPSLFIVGEDPEELYTIELTNLLITLAIRNSGYYGKFLRLYAFNDQLKFKILPIPSISLDDIYLKDKSDLEDFIEAVKNRNQGLRYLFVGEPGTGKTDTIKAIVAECLKSTSNGLTVIELDAGCRVPLNLILEYAEIFSPVLLCIDDIDLLVGSREGVFSQGELSSALQALDGFVEKDDHYLIATTNDRKLVDYALRRPGRFDLIIEFKELDPEFYPALVLRESKDERLSEVFKDERIRKRLANLKITGAFLVTLVKHLLKPRYEETRYDPQTVLALIDKLYRSFKLEVKPEEKIGFVGDFEDGD